MSNLYPIIRRKRRPLIVADKQTVMVASVEPVEAKAETVKAESKNEPAAAGNKPAKGKL